MISNYLIIGFLNPLGEGVSELGMKTLVIFLKNYSISSYLLSLFCIINLTLCTIQSCYEKLWEPVCVNNNVVWKLHVLVHLTWNVRLMMPFQSKKVLIWLIQKIFGYPCQNIAKRFIYFCFKRKIVIVIH